MDVSAVEQDAVGLQHLPHTVFHLILQHLVSGGSSGGGGSGGAAGTSSGGGGALVGSPLSVVQLAFSCKAMLQGVAVADSLWQQQCKRMGWSLDWLATLPPGTTCWQFFCLRMSVRHRLRRQLRQLARFLDPVSAAAIRPAVSVQEIGGVEAALQVPLPWELYELYRYCDGQHPAAWGGGSVQFLDAARLLCLHEMRQAVQERCGPLNMAKAFDELATAMAMAMVVPPQEQAGVAAGAEGRQESDGVGASSSSAAAGASSSAAGGSSSTAGASSSSSIRSRLDGICIPLPSEVPPEAPAVLLPFTSELRGRKVYCLDLQGRVWLASGFNTLFVAHSLTALIRRILT